ncbi:MAG TPA: dihydroorotate dehydrogenase electron transfer subunit [Bacteroidales bacterium]|nr:dihydroorotate dehydrogenase electron transfer subunit [Bacteroidales bacterium]HOK74668.1 dihydroorotate dehydrogenase electron transfer subunit [Bacteroidales bacterium]HOM39661.1 dihydroorotate dehydrogenase electron transfer subunit [Bacteroidales bacterium]HPP92057.1 dihydroorotate dehydrogenase electron transfer subunit [Bacteroidales bacterium]HQG55857.1 dihydroorotate dehydrogenase electron transfer subunit [Bacteroidales bacterium]
MAKLIRDFKVLNNTKITQDYFILELVSPEKLQNLMPGQFVQVRIDGSRETFLRRPFSVHDLDYDKNSIKILVQIAGKGTEKMSKLLPGEILNIIYPLGRPFSEPNKGENILLVGGGSGVAPLLFLAKHIKQLEINPDILLGFKSQQRIIETEEFEKYGRVFITTDDGSAGREGLVTEHPLLLKGKYDRIYCCGPEAMMKAVVSLAKSRNIFCEVSLEHLMACGIGICLCCIVKTTRGNICTCTEGPVINANELLW